jgi:hypothetical protein
MKKDCVLIIKLDCTPVKKAIHAEELLISKTSPIILVWIKMISITRSSLCLVLLISTSSSEES